VPLPLRAAVAGGVAVYGMYFSPGFGYHIDQTVGIAKGNDPESIFAVMSGTHTNGGCCFDYGNSESNDRDDGDGTMEVRRPARAPPRPHMRRSHPAIPARAPPPSP
jgi:hypothetical protein